jgi:hypothetical protein
LDKNKSFELEVQDVFYKVCLGRDRYFLEKLEKTTRKLSTPTKNGAFFIHKGETISITFHNFTKNLFFFAYKLKPLS